MLYAKAASDTVRVSGFLNKSSLVLVTCRGTDGARRVVPFDCQAGPVSQSVALKGFRVEHVVGVPLLKTRQPLYVARPVRNADEIELWFKSQGMGVMLDPADMHVTIAYSRKAVNWEALQPEEDDDVEIEPCLRRSVIPLGDKGAIVLRVDSPKLKSRWSEFIRKGASWDYEGYRPHVTLTYQGGVDAGRFVPFPGRIILGPERFEELDADFSPTLKAADKRKSPPKGYPEDKSQYALPDTYEFPIDEKHIHAAVSYFSSHHFDSSAQRRSAATKILNAARHHGVDVSDGSDVARAAHGA